MNAATPEVVLASRVVEAVRFAVGDGPMALHEPCFAGNEWIYLKECLDTTFVSSVGKFVDRFESDLAEYTGATHAVAVVNGTAALHVALQLAGVKPGDEVLIPALTFVATAAAVAYCGGTAHFADSEERTLGLDPRALREYLGSITEIRAGCCINRATGRVIRALVPMHAFGHPVDVDGMLGIARDFRLVLVEDAAESLGSTYRGRHTGTFGAMGTLSFNGNKTITTGGGGAILFGDPELARRAKHLTTTAKVPHRWEYRHDEIGYNYRLPNINAALGCAQLEQLPGFLAAKRNIFRRYQSAMADIPGVRVVAEPEGCRSNYWLQTLLLDEPHAGMRDAILAATNEAGLMTRPSWTLMHELGPYSACPRMPLPVAESLSRRLVNLPSSSHLDTRERAVSTESILLIGAGGHARACIDVIEQEGRFAVAGLVGLPREVGAQVLGYPVLGTDSDLGGLLTAYTHALITIGQIKTPEPRVRLFEMLERSTCELPVIVSPRAYVSRHAVIGAGTIVMHGAIVNAGAVVGRNCIINSQALVEHDVVIGDHCHVATAAAINSGVHIGSSTFIGSNSSVRQVVNIGERSLVGMGQRVLADCDEGTWMPPPRRSS